MRSCGRLRVQDDTNENDALHPIALVSIRYRERLAEANYYNQLSRADKQPARYPGRFTVSRKHTGQGRHFELKI